MSFPNIQTNDSESYVVDKYILVSQPTFLAFGVHHSNAEYQINFPANSYIKIKPLDYELWYLNINKIHHELSIILENENEQPTNEKLLQLNNTLDQIHNSEDNCTINLSFSVNQIIIQAKEHKDNKTIIRIHFKYFNEFCKAFKDLLFLPFQYPVYITSAFEAILHQTNITQTDIALLNNVTSCKLAEELLQTIKITKKDKKTFYLHKLLLRHKTEIIIAQKLQNAEIDMPNIVINSVLIPDGSINNLLNTLEENPNNQ